MEFLGAELKSNNVNYNDNPITRWYLTNTERMVDGKGNIQTKKSQDKRSLRIDGTAVLLNTFVGISEHMDNIKTYGNNY